MSGARRGWLLVVGLGVATPAGAAEKLRYNRDVRPILAENCFACHGPDSASRKADLRLDQRDLAVEQGAISPGKPDDSEIVSRVYLSADEDGLMPPKKSHKTLTAEQKDILKRWVAEGAVYEPHWSFVTPTRPPLPSVRNNGWVRNPIDAFILADLEGRGLTPAPEADRRTLARRLSLDLTGLPPTPADVEAFVADTSADYYETFVAKLMASPRWGEHRGRYWLDAARYADTHGIHFDNFREMWSYRDWVITAFNRNLPFDQFTREQLAGDLLPNPSLDQQVATGFNRCNITTNEGGAISEEYLVLYARDRTETASQVWMGLTTGCAVCHDHKYDPVSQKDFYQLSAFFNNTTQAAMDGNVPNTPPVITVPRPDDRKRYEGLARELVGLRKKLDERRKAARPDFDQWLAKATPAALRELAPDERPAFYAWLDEGVGDAVRYVADGRPGVATAAGGDLEWAAEPGGGKAFSSAAAGRLAVPAAGDFDTKQPFSASMWFRVNRRAESGSLVARMDPAAGHRGWDVWLEGGQLAVHLVHKWDADAIKVRMKQGLPDNAWHHFAATYDGSGKAAGVKLYLDGNPQQVEVEADRLTGSVRTAVPLTLAQRSDGGGRLNRVGLKDLALYSHALHPREVARLAGPVQAAAVLAKPADKRAGKDADKLFEWWLRALDGPAQEVAGRLAEADAEEMVIRSRGTIAHVMSERPAPPEAFVLNRGEYDQRRDKVVADTPKALPAFADGLPRNRLGLAEWLLAPDHPLTARVTVNRFWQEAFGTGLVRTAGDFGVSGELPSHPELLDWLAVEFREQGWDVKKFFTLLVTSAAYRQAAVASPAKLEKDPQNRLLSRGPRFRMDAEMVRDYALAASGLLVEKVGGPSVKPYQPDGVWEAVAMRESNTRYYKRDDGDKLYRRSLYTFWKRSAPPAFLDVMNAPNRETCAVRRDRTNTPLQALMTLNDVQYVEAARVLAEAALKDGGGTDAERLQFVAGRLLARPFRPEELKVVRASLKGLLADYRAKPAEAAKLVAYGEAKADPKLDAATLAGWTMLVNEVMNLDEVLNK
jgi:mono/diheme cytochrome c family protein